MENNNPTIIPNPIRCNAKEFPYDCSTIDVYDEKLEKSQEDLNQEFNNLNESVGQPNGVASLNTDGKVPDNQLSLVSDKITDTSLGLTQAQINAIVLNSGVTASLTATQDTVFVGQESNIGFVATISTSADSIKIMHGDIEIASGEGTSVSGLYNIFPNEAGNIPFTAEFTIGNFVKTVPINVSAVYPIKYGAGDAYTDASTQASARKTPAGVYNITVPENEKYVFFVIPGTMNITSAKMGGFDFPLQRPVNVSIEGVDYKSYQSYNTYDAGTITIEIF